MGPKSGCSMCVGINGDLVAPGNVRVNTKPQFPARQRPGARTHLMSARRWSRLLR